MTAATSRAGSRTSVRAGAVLALGMGVVLVVQWVQGAANYLTDPVSVVAQLLAVVGVAVLARRGAASDRAGAAWLALIAVSALSYLALSAAATSAASFGSPAAAPIIAVWSAWWIVPLGSMGLAALHALAAPAAWRWPIGVALGLSVLLGAAGSKPDAPFEGLPTIAPEGWPATVLSSASAQLAFLALMVGMVACIVRACRVPRDDRARTVAAAAAASIPPLLILVCVGLAVLRDPGDVDPSAGSVAWLVGVSAGSLLTAGLLFAGRHGPLRASRWLLVAAVVAWCATVIVLGTPVLLGALALEGTLLAGLAVIASALTVVALGVFAGRRLLLSIVPRPEHLVAAARIPQLSVREAEVLELVAEGARDADIAATLFLSTRTVETHLRRIFQKLELSPELGRNRRVIAARAWVESHPDTV